MRTKNSFDRPVPPSETREMKSGSMEDVDLGTNPAVTDYAIGARGIDAISKTSGGNTVVVYPIYDAHGNPDSLRSFPCGGITSVGSWL